MTFIRCANLSKYDLYCQDVIEVNLKVCGISKLKCFGRGPVSWDSYFKYVIKKLRDDKVTKRELVEKFRMEMPEFTGTEEEIEIKKALYVYIQLAKMKSFDEKFFFGNILLSNKTITQSRKDRKNLDKVANKKKITCITLSHLYKAVLNDLGISCEICKEDSENIHLNNIITLKSGRKISADTQLDLYRIQTRLKLKHFYPLKEEFMTAEDLTKMLIEVGYIRDGDDYRDCEIRKIQEELEGLGAVEALSKVVKSKEVYSGIKGLETSEAYKYYYSIIKTILGEKRLGGYYQFACELKKDNKPTDKYTFCVYLDTKDWHTIKPYFYSQKEGRLKPCELEKIEELEKEGLHLDLYSGARKLKKYAREKAKFLEKSEKEDDEER